MSLTGLALKVTSTLHGRCCVLLPRAKALFFWSMLPVSPCISPFELGFYAFSASEGVQAQTLSVYHAAKDRGVKIIPVLNKVCTSDTQTDCY